MVISTMNAMSPKVSPERVPAENGDAVQGDVTHIAKDGSAKHPKDQVIDLETDSVEVSQDHEKMLLQLLDAIQEDNEEQLQELLEKVPPGVLDTPVNSEGQDVLLLHKATKLNAPHLLTRLLEAGASINAMDSRGTTAVHLAADKGFTNVLQILLDHTADITIQDTDGWTALHYASTAAHQPAVEKLLDVGADPNVRDRKYECTPLHLLAINWRKHEINSKSCLDTLFKNSSLNMDGKNKFGQPPLQLAGLCGWDYMTVQLILHGARVGCVFGTASKGEFFLPANVLENVLNGFVRASDRVTDYDFKIILDFSVLAKQDSEISLIMKLNESNEHRYLLHHPIISTFLFIKWQKIRGFYIVNIIFYFFYVIMLWCYILLYHQSIKWTNADTSIYRSFASTDGVKISFQVFIFLFTFSIAGKELIQAWEYRSVRYMLKLQNYMQWFVVILANIVLFEPFNVVVQQGIAAWLVIISGLELMLKLGRFSWFGLEIYIAMFTTVVKNLTKFIFMFSFILFAFSISFYLLFQSHPHFKKYSLSLIKTLVMSTGEMGYIDLPLEVFPGFAPMLFLLFVFLIVLGFMNLLNGLAISDIQAIQSEAKIYSSSNRVDLIDHLEGFTRIKYDNICCKPLMKLVEWWEKRNLIFKCIQNRRIAIFPNHHKAEDRWQICTCKGHNYSLDESQIAMAKKIVADRVSSIDRFTIIEQRLDECLEQIKVLQAKKN
ncbi:unnamed protein product [Meganyctiphanes norvegica]|uniref:Ion transport domain-containing protein n=1 Tax=Meganyctiphanes norvegica TaxID=48144 RepID=A0AAV2RPZ2_MEGNR